MLVVSLKMKLRFCSIFLIKSHMFYRRLMALRLPRGTRCTGHRIEPGLGTRHFVEPEWVESFTGPWCPECQEQIEAAENRAQPAEFMPPARLREPESVMGVNMLRAFERLSVGVEHLASLLEAGYGFAPAHGQIEQQEEEVQEPIKRCFWCNRHGHAFPNCTYFPDRNAYVGQHAKEDQYETPGWRAYQQHRNRQQQQQQGGQDRIPPPPPEQRRRRSRSR